MALENSSPNQHEVLPLKNYLGGIKDESLAAKLEKVLPTVESYGSQSVNRAKVRMGTYLSRGGIGWYHRPTNASNRFLDQAIEDGIIDLIPVKAYKEGVRTFIPKIEQGLGEPQILAILALVSIDQPWQRKIKDRPDWATLIPQVKSALGESPLAKLIHDPRPPIKRV